MACPADFRYWDAIHTAIVAVRAGEAIQPGQRCGLNEHREAVLNPKGPGVADPFLKKPITRGQPFWLLLCQDEVPNVQHVWNHPEFDFSPPARETVKNSTIKKFAQQFGVTYDQIMEAAAFVVEHDEPAPYPGTGTKTKEELTRIMDEDDAEMYDFWGEWSSESLHEFYNNGSECCPEYEYPECSLYVVE